MSKEKTPTKPPKPTAVINLVDIKAKKANNNDKASEQEATEYSNEELVSEGAALFNEQIAEGAKGFISIVFDETEQPMVVLGGNIDVFRTIGTLDFCKTELINTLIYGSIPSDIQFTPDETEDA